MKAWKGCMVGYAKNYKTYGVLANKVEFPLTTITSPILIIFLFSYFEVCNLILPSIFYCVDSR